MNNALNKFSRLNVPKTHLDQNKLNGLLCVLNREVKSLALQIPIFCLR